LEILEEFQDPFLEYFFLGRNTLSSFVRCKKEGGVMSEKTYNGIPRNEITWDPKIDCERCIVCGKCLDFCHVGAFRLEEKDGKRRMLVNPNRCIVFCKGCQAICPEGAITHPSEEETKKIIDDLKETKT
jgi:ferredoxin